VASGGGHGGGHGGGGHKHHDDHEEHEEHVNHEAWVIPYADMLTLLMVMFLALFATGRVDMEKFKKLADNMRNEFGGSAQMVSVGSGGSGSTPMEGGNTTCPGAGQMETQAIRPANAARRMPPLYRNRRDW
jgi:chemotaxis protein MotB